MVSGSIVKIGAGRANYPTEEERKHLGQSSWRVMRMSQIVRCPRGAVVEMHDNPCASRQDYEQVKHQLLEAGRSSTRVVVDCNGVHMLGASFLSALLTAFKFLGCRPGDLVLCRLQPLPRQVFAVTRLDLFLPVYESVEEALAGSWPDPESHVVEERSRQ